MSLLDELIGAQCSYLNLPYTEKYRSEFSYPYYASNHFGLATPETERKRKQAKLDETRQLKRPGACYLTGLEPSGKYTSYFGGHDDYEKGFMEGHSSGLADGMNIIERRNGVDLDRFKQECEEIDNEY